jgi:uncharacterized protein YecT (DUF1311 family)
MGMRAIALVIVAIQIGLALPVCAEDSPAADRSIRDVLPLFFKNHCEEIRNPADQMFCGDPELNAIGTRLNDAITERLNRIPNRNLAIVENAEWVRDRNSSCGIFGRLSVKGEDIKVVRDCLLRETRERIEILSDPNFDCLATNTTAGMLICSEPSLALAKAELNSLIVPMINKLNDSEAREAFAEFERWGRDRDRKCGLEEKQNVPLRDLASSEGCLAGYFKNKIAEVTAANGDPKKLFGRPHLSPLPNADAVDLCVAQIHSAKGCLDFLAVDRVFQIDSEVADKNADVIAEVEMMVLAPFTACSPVAMSCTGTCWDLTSNRPKSTPGTRDNFVIGYRLRIEKSFAFQKAENGDWRCGSAALQPVNTGLALTGP